MSLTRLLASPAATTGTLLVFVAAFHPRRGLAAVRRSGQVELPGGIVELDGRVTLEAAACRLAETLGWQLYWPRVGQVLHFDHAGKAPWWPVCWLFYRGSPARLAAWADQMAEPCWVDWPGCHKLAAAWPAWRPVWPKALMAFNESAGLAAGEKLALEPAVNPVNPVRIAAGSAGQPPTGVGVLSR